MIDLYYLRRKHILFFFFLVSTLQESFLGDKAYSSQIYPEHREVNFLGNFCFQTQGINLKFYLKQSSIYYLNQPLTSYKKIYMNEFRFILLIYVVVSIIA